MASAPTATSAAAHCCSLPLSILFVVVIVADTPVLYLDFDCLPLHDAEDDGRVHDLPAAEVTDAILSLSLSFY